MTIILWSRRTVKSHQCLGDPETTSGPLNFEEISTTNPTRVKVKFEDWKHCRDICLQENILPPTIGSQIASTPSKQKKKEKPEKRKDNLKSRIEKIWKPNQYSNSQYLLRYIMSQYPKNTSELFLNGTDPNKLGKTKKRLNKIRKELIYHSVCVIPM